MTERQKRTAVEVHGVTVFSLTMKQCSELFHIISSISTDLVNNIEDLKAHPEKLFDVISEFKGFLIFAKGVEFEDLTTIDVQDIWYKFGRMNPIIGNAAQVLFAAIKERYKLNEQGI